MIYCTLQDHATGIELGRVVCDTEAVNTEFVGNNPETVKALRDSAQAVVDHITPIMQNLGI